MSANDTYMYICEGRHENMIKSNISDLKHSNLAVTQGMIEYLEGTNEDST